MLTLSGTMLQDVKLASTPLKLHKGMRVALTFPRNQPNPQGKWFARPLDGIWPDGIERSDEDSILLDPGDCTVDHLDQDEIQAIANQQTITVIFPIESDDVENDYLEVKITSEGVICDHWQDDNHVGTWGGTADEIADEICH